jgi:hypothetical protein
MPITSAQKRNGSYLIRHGESEYTAPRRARTAHTLSFVMVDHQLRLCRERVAVVLALALLFVISVSCRSSDEAQGDRTPRRVAAMDEAGPTTAPRLTTDAPDVATVQLHVTGSETEPPVIDMTGQGTLTLSFDVIEDRGRSLSVYFYHTDRSWRRDLSPAEYLETYHRDDLLNYQSSQATEVQYVHFEYEFPNDAIGFRISGNYVVRVAESDNEDVVLFERAFFVTEQAVPIEVGLDNVMIAQLNFPAVQPTAVFTPLPETQANIFDYSVCFSRGGRLADVRCVSDPSLMRQPALEFYLQPQSSFAPVGGEYLLDLAVLQPGGQVERLDVTSSPFEVVLAPDYVRFGADDLSQRLNGQVVVDEVVRDVGDPGTQAEYVATQFSLVTEGDSRLAGAVYVVGAFTGWQRHERALMTWNDVDKRYTARLLLKQGRYEYRYTSTNSGSLEALSQSLPRNGDIFVAMVYYRDIYVQTDRLLGIGSGRMF